MVRSKLVVRGSAEQSPSSGLLLRRAEHSAVPVCVTVLPDAHPDAPEPAVHPAQHLADAVHPSADVRPWAHCAWDAWDDVVPEQMEHERHCPEVRPLLVTADEDAGISA